MNIVYITLKTLAPVVLTAAGSSRIVTSCSHFFSGTVLRGVLAGMYIRKNQLGKNAEDDAEFCRFFFDSLRFVQANPVVQGHRAAVLPLSLMKAKGKDAAHPIMDLLKDAPQAGYKGLKGMAWVDGAVIHPAEVHSSMGFHMSRASEKERLGGHSQDGKVFTYESIDAGQVFRGAVIGEKEDLQDFIQAFGKEQPLLCRIGRSKYTQYGQCEIRFSDAEYLPEIDMPKRVFLVLDTSLIPDFGTVSCAENALQCVADTMNLLTHSHEFSLGDIYGTNQSVENFVGIWGMNRPQQQALAAGTVFELCKKSAWTVQDKIYLQECMYGGAGARTEEGFGQLRLWNHSELTLAAQTKKKPAAAAGFIQTDEVKKVVRHILKKRLAEQLRIQAFEDVTQMEVKTNDSLVHTFARLEMWLGNRTETEGLSERFLTRFANEVREGSPLERHLRALRIHHKTLFEIFGDRGLMPFEENACQETLRQAVPEMLAKQADFQLEKDKDDLFYEYWLWFFRHGRKQAVRLNRAGKEQQHEY